MAHVHGEEKAAIQSTARNRQKHSKSETSARITTAHGKPLAYTVLPGNESEAFSSPIYDSSADIFSSAVDPKLTRMLVTRR